MWHFHCAHMHCLATCSLPVWAQRELPRHAQRPAPECAQLNTETETGLAADSALLGSGGTVTVLLGSQSIGTGALSGSGRLLALTSPFTVTITVPAGTASGSQLPCLQCLSHPVL